MNKIQQEANSNNEKQYHSVGFNSILRQGLKCKQYYNAQEECVIEQLYPVHQPLGLLILEILLYIISGGLLFIVFSWKNEWRFQVFYKIVSISEASSVVVYGPDKDVQITRIVQMEDKEQKVFSYRFQKYVYSKQTEMFEPYGDSIISRCQNEIIESSQNGLSQSQITSSVTHNGVNTTDIPDRGVLALAFDEFFSPFFLFQVASCLLWFYDTYEMYASIIIITSTLSILFKIYEERSNFNRIKKFSYFRGSSTVIRNGETKVIPSNELAYGDVVILKEGDTAPCDLVVVQGSVIVNESMLTGESVPIIKSPLANINSPFTENRQNVIYGGSIIMMVSNSKSVVIRIGFETLKGNLIRSILYPKSHNQISFQNDSMKFISILLVIAVIQFFIALPTFLDNIDRGVMEVEEVIKKVFDLITISVPPALPTCLSFGVSFSLNRLRRKQIFCINPEKINICGIVQSICFDKTGTLTEDLLSFKLISSYQNNQQKFEDQFSEEVVKKSNNSLPQFSRVQRSIIASCHSLMIYKDDFIGDPLDIEMFKASSYLLVDNEESNNKIKENDENTKFQGYEILQELTCKQNYGSPIYILKRFQFDADVQRMSAVVGLPKENQKFIYTKGSPERVQTICRPETIPSDYKSKLQQFTNEGYRVLALAYRKLDQVNLEQDREVFECDQTFAGFLVFENKLKSQTIQHIEILQKNEVKVRMVTGDNPETSLNIAKQCGILNTKKSISLLDFTNNCLFVNGVESNIEDFMKSVSFVQGQEQLVITGNFFEEYLSTHDQIVNTKGDDKETLNLQTQTNDIESSSSLKRSEIFYSLLLQHGKVFARMKPDQKQGLINLLQKYENLKQGYSFIGMCGDGANDCQALKDADMGISLGEAEASVAAAFTSKVVNISVIEYILREGRCCLTTSFQCFKFMALYSLIQGFATTLMYQRGSIPADMQILYWDLFIIIPLAFFLGLTEASDNLTNKIPAHRLFSHNNIISVVGQGIIQLVFLIFSISITTTQSWYRSPVELIEDMEVEDTFMLDTCYDSTILFWVSNFQYIFTVIAFSVGSVHKKPFYTNILFSFFLVSISALSFLIIFTEQVPLLDFFTIIIEAKNSDDEVVSSMDSNWKLVILAIILANGLVTIIYEKYILDILINLFEKVFPKSAYNNEATMITQATSKDVQSGILTPTINKKTVSQFSQP